MAKIDYLNYEGLKYYRSKHSEEMDALEARLTQAYSGADTALSTSLGEQIEVLRKKIPEDVYITMKVGETEVKANGQSTLELIAGSNVTLTPDATNKSITITAKDTTYPMASDSVDGLLSKEDYVTLRNLGAAYAPDNSTIVANDQNQLIVNNVPATKISGVLNISQIPTTALERLYVVANKAALLALTSEQVQNGDTVKVTSYADGSETPISKMFLVVDESKLGTSDAIDAFTEYTASTYWSNIKDIPEIAYKGELAKVATSGSYKDLTDKPTIPSSTNQLTNNGAPGGGGDPYTTESALSSAIEKINASINGINYAGSDEPGGVANSAVKLDTGTIGSNTQPVYFNDGIPTTIGYTIEKSVPSDAKFTDTVYIHPDSEVSAGTYRSVTVNAQGHVTSGTNPTTLDEYGITDAKIVDGTITLGSGSIEPLTSQSVVNGDNTASWGSSVTVGTVGGISLTFKMPGNPNTDTWRAIKVNNEEKIASSSSTPLNIKAGSNISLAADTSGNVVITSSYVDTTYSAGSGISFSGTTINNSGVRAISTGASNGTISVNTNGSTSDVLVYGLGNLAYKNSLSYSDVGAAASGHTHSDATQSSAGFMSAKDKEKLDNLNTSDIRALANMWSQKQTYSAAGSVDSSSSVGAGAINVSSGGIVASGGIKGNKVYNAVWNDLADCIPVDDGCTLEPGRCYVFDGERYTKSSRYLDDGIIGIHSDTYGMHMGSKEGVKQMDVAVAGFVLAYVDKTYRPGTPLTCGPDGTLTEILKQDKIEWPEKVVAVFWKDEPDVEWGDADSKVKVDGRKWVKVR